MNWAERRSIYENNQKAGSNTGESLEKNLSGDRWAQRREQYNQYNSGTNNTAVSQHANSGDNSRMWKQRNAMRNSAYRAQEYGRLLGLDFEEQQNKINATKADIDAEKSNNSKLVSRYSTLSRQKDPLNKNKDELFSLNEQIRASSEKIKKAEEEAERLENEYRSANLYKKQDKQREQIREHGDYQATVSNAIDDPYYRKVNNLLGVKSKADLYSKRSQNKVLSENSGKIMSEMTDEERNTYNYIFDTEGREAAKEYMEILEYSLASRYKDRRTKDAQEMANSGFGGAAGTAMSIAEGAVSDTGGALSYYGEKFLRDIGWADDSLPINYQKTFASSTWSNALQEQVTENIDNPVWQFLYSTGVSMADNAVRNIILAPLGTPGILGAMALRVAGQNINEGLSRGMTEEQAALYGAQNALGEVVGEIIPLDRLLKIKSPKTLIEAVKTIGGQAVVEGLGEGITTLWNNLVSASTAGTLSDYNMAKAAYMQQGMNEEEAEKQATKDSIHQLLLDMAGGFISGGVMGGGAMAIDRIANTAYGKKTENRMSAALTSDIDETETGKLAEKYERKGMDTEEAAQKAQEDIQNKKAKEYTKQGMSKEEALSAVQAADIATAEKNKKMRGNILSRGLNSEEGSEANKAAKAIKSKLQSGEKVSAGEWQSLIKTTARTIDISETKSAIKKAAQKSGETITEANTDTMAAAMVKDFHGGYMTGSENKLIKNSKAAMTAYGELTGVDYNTGEKIKEVAARKEQAQKQSIGAKINSTLSRQAAEYSGEEKSEGYKNILSKTYKAYLSIVEHASGEDRTKVWSKFGAEDYAEMFDAFYNAGKSGEYTLESLLSGIEKEYNAQNAAKEAFSTAYELGREESKKESTKTAKTKQAELEAKIKAGKENKNANAPRGIVRSISQKELETGSAKKAGAKAVDMKRHFSQKQRAAISVMREFAKNADINVVFYETEGGKGANGWYDSKTDTIYIDLFSGFDNEQAMLRTLSHELTHFIEKYAPKHHNEFKNFLFDYYYGKDGGKTLDRLIDEERRLAPEKNREYWENEVVANASERFVNDEGAMRALISEHADVAKSVDQWFSKMNYALRRAFKGITASNEAVKELLANAEVFSEAQKRWNALLEESVKAKKAVGAAEESGEAKFSMRQNITGDSGKVYGDGVYLDSNLLDGLSDKERVQMVKARIAELGGQTFTAYDGNTPVEIKIENSRKKFENKSGRIVSVNKDLTTKNIDKGIKQEAVVLSDELISASNYKENAPAHHSHGWLDNNGKNDWEKRTVLIQEKNNSVWEATLHIANAQNGEKILYDIDPIKKVERSGKSDTTSTTDSIRQGEENVNTQFSMRISSGAVTLNVEKSTEEDGYTYDNIAIMLDGKEVGTIGMVASENEPYLERIDIDEEYRNKGIGTDALRLVAEKYGEFLIAPDNEDAKRLYERYGDESSSDNAAYIDQGYGVYSISSVPESKGYTARQAAAQKDNAKFSARRDADYMKAVENGDTETAQKLVDEAAKAAGYDTEPLYHGTRNFGFTKLDVSKSDDKISFFATSNPDMAQTYSGKSGTKKISGALGSINGLTEEEVVDRLNEEAVTDGFGMESKYRIMRPADIKAFFADIDKRIEKLDNVVDKKIAEYADRIATDFNHADERVHSQLVRLSEALQFYNYDKMSTPLWVLLNNTDVFNSTEKKRYGNLEADIRLRNGLAVKKGIDEGAVIKESLDRYEIRVKTFEDARNELAANAASGNYILRGKTKGLLEIDGNGHNWNDIFATLEPEGGNTLYVKYDSSTSSLKLSDKNGEFANIPAKTLSEAESAMARAITKQFGSHFAATVFAQAKDQLRNSATAEVAIKTTGKTDTRNIAQFAKEQGYRGAKITNIYDNGGRGANADTGNVYIYFYPQEDVKSADAVTYDDKGNVIPLSERFNAKNDDIRYSMREKRDYSYDALVKKPDIKIVNVSEPLSASRAGIVAEAKKNAAQIGKFNAKDGSVSVYVKDIDTDIIVSKDGLKHSLDRRLKLNAPVVLKAGEILQNSIVINELTPQKAEAEMSYVLIGASKSNSGDFYIIRSVVNKFSNELTEMDVLYAINAKKENQLRSMRPGFLHPVTDSTISISDFLDYVNEYFPDVLPESVLRHYGYTERPVGKLGESALYQLRREDINRLNILEEQETRFANEIKALEKEYKKALEEEQRQGVLAQDYARAEGVLAGQMNQGAKDAAELRRVKERFANKEDAYINELRERRAQMVEERKAATKVRNEAEARGVLAGQMAQGAKDAAKLRVTAESYENRIKAYRNKLSEVREKRDAVLKARREAFENYKAERADSARREVLRKRIAKGVRSLNTMLLNPTDNRHIPQELRGAVAGFLGNFTNNTSVFSKSKLETLKAAYSDIAKEDSGLNDLYDPDIAEYISKMEKVVDGKRLSELSYDELFYVKTITDYFSHMIRDGNALFIDGKKQEISSIAAETVDAANKRGDKLYRGGIFGKALRFGDTYFNYKNTTPVYFFKHMGGGMGKLYNDMLYNGQKTYSQDINESRQFMTAIFEKYHVWDWTSLNRKNKNDRLKFETERGIKLDMSRNEVLTAYATYKRGEANGDGGAHMLEGGIVVKSKATESFFKTFNESRKGIPLTVNDIQEMFKFLTEEQKACADAVVQYLTVTDGEKRNETSMRLYGYKKFNETYYFPYRVASDYTKSRAGEEIKPEGGSASGGSKMLKNMGSSKALTPNANAAIVIDDFFKVAAKSMNETARYHAFAVQQDNFMRVLNYKDVVDAEHGSTSVKQAIHDSYGNEGLNYITGFLGDIFNGAVQQNNDDIFGRLFGKFKKTAVAANLSVAIQQPSAIMRATALIDEKYLIKTVGQKNRLDEMFDYSSTAFLKQMGRFDVGTGRSAEEYILKPELRGKKYLKQLFATGEYSTGEFDDLTGYLSEKADWVTWGHLMNAVMAEIEDTTELVRGTEKFKEAVGRRFDEIVNATQVYDSILTKSPIMRSKNAFAQLSSAFMTEPTLSYNMVLDGFRALKTNPKYLGKTVKAYFLSVVANALLKSVIGAMRDRDEDDTYFEKYAEKLTENIMSDLVPIFNLPYASQIKDILQGGTVENQAYGMFSDTVSAIKKSFKKAESGDYFGALSEFTPVFNLFGLPVRNIVRDITAVFSTAFNSKPLSDTTLEGIFDAAGEGVLGALGLGNKSKTAEIKEEMKSGKPTNIRKATNELIEKYIASGKSESSAKGYIKASLTNYWKPIYINAGSEKQAKIRKALYNTGLYKNADEINKMCKKWLEDK